MPFQLLHWEGAVPRRERDLAKVGVEGSSPFARSRFSWYLKTSDRPPKGGFVVSILGEPPGERRPDWGGDDARSLCFLLFEFLCRKNRGHEAKPVKGSR